VTSSNIAESALKLLATEGLPREQRSRRVEEDQDEKREQTVQCVPICPDNPHHYLWKDADPRHPHPKRSRSRVREAAIAVKEWPPPAPKAISRDLYFLRGVRQSPQTLYCVLLLEQQHRHRQAWQALDVVHFRFHGRTVVGFDPTWFGPD